MTAKHRDRRTCDLTVFHHPLCTTMSENVTETIRIPPLLSPVIRVPQSYDDFRGESVPLVIDNGSTTLRFGFATSPRPTSVSNVVARFRDRKQNKPLLLYGDAVDIESGARTQAKTPWEGDVLLNFDALVSTHLRQSTFPCNSRYGGMTAK